MWQKKYLFLFRRDFTWIGFIVSHVFFGAWFGFRRIITRAADVMLIERRKLILVLRETPFSLIHIENMKTITLAGGIICPAIPSFYSKPETIEQALETVVERILALAGFELDSYRWGEEIKTAN